MCRAALFYDIVCDVLSFSVPFSSYFFVCSLCVWVANAIENPSVLLFRAPLCQRVECVSAFSFLLFALCVCFRSWLSYFPLVNLQSLESTSRRRRFCFRSGRNERASVRAEARRERESAEAPLRLAFFSLRRGACTILALILPSGKIESKCQDEIGNSIKFD